MYSDFITGMIDKSFEKTDKLMLMQSMLTYKRYHIVTNLFLNECKYIFPGRKKELLTISVFPQRDGIIWKRRE